MLAQGKSMLYWYQRAGAGADFDNKGPTKHKWCVEEAAFSWARAVTHFFPHSNMCLMVQPSLVQICSQVQGHSISKCCLPEPQQWPARAFFTTGSCWSSFLCSRSGLGPELMPASLWSPTMRGCKGHRQENTLCLKSGHSPHPNPKTLHQSGYCLPSFQVASTKLPAGMGTPVKPNTGLAESIDQQSCTWPSLWFGRKLGFACVIHLRIYMLQHH